MSKLNFGCGIDRKEGYDNVDKENFNFNIFPYPIQDNIYDEILVKDVLEHLNEPDKVLDELHRISVHNGIIKIIAPYYNSSAAYNSIEHKHYFNSLSFESWDQNFKGNKLSKKNFVVKVKLTPTKLGRLFPSFIRKKASFVIGEVYNSIEVEMKVIK